MDVVTHGPWRIRNSVFEGKAAIVHVEGNRRDVVATEDVKDLEKLHDALGIYLEHYKAGRL